jgi:hypothetical protein
LTEPDEPLTGKVLIVEGAKKGIVTYTNIGTKPGLNVIAVPSKTPADDMLGMLKDCDLVYLALDPDAYEPVRSKTGKITAPAVNRVASKLGRERVIIVKLPCKPDDLFTEYGGDKDDFMAFVNQGIKA